MDGELDCNFLCLVKECLKPKTSTGVTYDQLVKLDERYFKNAGKHALIDEQAAYRLATWLFDHEGDEAQCRKKVKEQLPHVYLAMLEHFIDGNHDT